MSEKTCAPPWQDGGARRPTRWQRSATCVGGRRAPVKGTAGGFEGAGARRERRETQLIFVLRFLLSSLSPTRPRAPLRPRQGPATAQAGAARSRAASGTPAREVDWRSCMHGHAARAKEKGSKRGNSFRSPDSFSQRPPGLPSAGGPARQVRTCRAPLAMVTFSRPAPLGSGAGRREGVGSMCCVEVKGGLRVISRARVVVGVEEGRRPVPVAGAKEGLSCRGVGAGSCSW